MIDIASKQDEKIIGGGKKLLVGYVLAGYPTTEKFFDVLKICMDSPLDILEIGYPSNNPYADGPVIAAAHGKVDKNIACSLEYWERIRKSCSKPIWLMAYNTDYVETGRYRSFAQEGVVDAIVIPDTDIVHRKGLLEEQKPYGVDVVGFSNPDMTDKEFSDVFSSFSLVYEQLYVGRTGNSHEKEEYQRMLQCSLSYSSVVGFAGFGINSKERVEKLYQDGFHGAIIGTEIMKHMNVSNDSLRIFLADVGRAKETWR
jgi:tryptophan synthase alpha chain